MLKNRRGFLKMIGATAALTVVPGIAGAEGKLKIKMENAKLQCKIQNVRTKMEE